VILAVAGGPEPATASEIEGLLAACWRRRVRVLRTLDTPGTGASVWAAAVALSLGLGRGDRGFTVEQYSGEARVRVVEMLRGSRVGATALGLLSVGPANAVAVWPGGDGDAARTVAAELHVRVVSVVDLVRDKHRGRE
jgi:hypothetical protein